LNNSSVKKVEIHNNVVKN